MMRALLTLATFVGASLLPHSALACSCMPPPSTCGAYTSGDAVFVGTVIAREVAERKGELDFKIGVIDAFKGVTVKEITVREKTSTAACGYPFRVGESYLIFARHGHGLYYSGICSRTQPLAVATDDLEMLRQIKTGRVTSRVLGTALRRQLSVNGGYYGYEDAGAMIGLPIAVRGAGVSRETLTDATGRFVFEELPPGDYQVEPRWPSGLKELRPLGPIRVSECGAGDISLIAVTDAPLGGVVRAADGIPIELGVVVTVVRSDQTSGGLMDPKLHSASVFADANGKWAFHGLPPGRYVVGVNLLEPPTISSPYPRTFYTAGTETREATPVDVVDGRQVQLDLRVGRRLGTRSVSGVVLDEKETPVRGADILLSDVELPTAIGFRKLGTSDEHGRFSVLAWEGRSYLVRAKAYPRLRNLGSRPIAVSQTERIDPNGNVIELELLLVPEAPIEPDPPPLAVGEKGYWVDQSTGLTWTVRDNGSPMSGEQAIRYCQSLSLGGFAWRLPTIEELYHVYDPSMPDGKSKSKPPIELGGHGRWVWSGTAGSSQFSPSAWGLFFGDGSRYEFLLDYGGHVVNVRALCVSRSN